MNRRLATANPVAYEHYLAMALNTFANALQVQARWRDVLRPTEEAVEISGGWPPPTPKRTSRPSQQHWTTSVLG